MAKSLDSLSIAPGTYVFGVSGGVDSVVLLDILRRLPGVHLIVAHFDHGMREESRQDRDFVRELAMSHNISFVTERSNLGSIASEATAREARYKFLRHVRDTSNASQIIVAHHQDDVLETALINMLRGTGRKGLTSMRSTEEILRPMLHIQKCDIVAYAKDKNLAWREDASNTDTRFMRNYVRHHLLPASISKNADFRELLLRMIAKQHIVNKKIDQHLEEYVAKYVTFKTRSASMTRYQLIMLPTPVALAVLQAIYVRLLGHTIERPLAKKALHFAKSARAGAVLELNNRWQLRVTKAQLFIEER